MEYEELNAVPTNYRKKKTEPLVLPKTKIKWVDGTPDSQGDSKLEFPKPTSPAKQ